MPTENILIDIQVRDEQLLSTIERLQQFGTIDKSVADSFKATQSAIKSTGTEAKGMIQTFNQVKTTASTMGKSVSAAFNQGVTDALNEAGVSMEEFEASLKKTASSVPTLKQELKQLTEAIAQAKANGTDLGEEFDNMVRRAGILKDAVGDASKEIANAGSDTRGLDNVIGSVNAVVGAFGIAQGVSALFGKENEDLQKGLLKLNAVMAISQGLQQVSNALTKEGSLAKLADATATGLQTAAQRIYTFVTGKATQATVGFKIALASTGIGLFVLAVAALVEVLNDTDTSMDEVNADIERQNTLIESNNALIQRQTDLRVAQSKAMGQAQSAQMKIQAQAIESQRDFLISVNKSNVQTLNGLDKTSDAWFKLNDQIQKNSDEIENLNNQIKVYNVEGAAQLKQEAKDYAKLQDEKNKKAIENAKRLAEERRLARQKQLEDELAAIELQLLAVQKGSQQEIDLQKKVVGKKAEIELNAAELTENKIKLIKAKSLDDQLLLQSDFNKKLTAEAIQGLIERNSAELANINISSEEKLRLTLENITAASQLEIEAAQGNADKIKAIKAKATQDSKAAVKQSLDEQLEYEISINASRQGAARRTLERLVSDEKAGIEQRKQAILSLLNMDLSVNQQRIDNLQKELDQKLISEKDYNIKYAALLDERNRLQEKANQDAVAITKSSMEQQAEAMQEVMEIAVPIYENIVNLITSINDLATQRDNIRIEESKRRLAELVEAGAISRKNAEIESKKIEAAEKQARIRQAQREKQQALFNGIISIPQAFLAGLKTGIPGLQFVYAALAAAQVALIAARPIPKFFKGKKDAYAGPGVVGDQGSELIERDGKMYLVTRPTVMDIKSKDKIYTHSETKMMLPSLERMPMPNTHVVEAPRQQGMKIEYDKLGKAVAKHQKHLPSIEIHKDFISESLKDALMKTNYYNNRYKF